MYLLTYLHNTVSSVAERWFEMTPISPITWVKPTDRTYWWRPSTFCWSQCGCVAERQSDESNHQM